MGGLGNQLFQVFATLAYALQHGCTASIVQKTLSLGNDNASVRGVYGDNIFHRVKFSAPGTPVPSDVLVVEAGLWAFSGDQPSPLGAR
jgi:hypothetical protein